MLQALLTKNTGLTFVDQFEYFEFFITKLVQVITNSLNKIKGSLYVPKGPVHYTITLIRIDDDINFEFKMHKLEMFKKLEIT